MNTGHRETEGDKTGGKRRDYAGGMKRGLAGGKRWCTWGKRWCTWGKRGSTWGKRGSTGGRRGHHHDWNHTWRGRTSAWNERRSTGNDLRRNVGHSTRRGWSDSRGSALHGHHQLWRHRGLKLGGNLRGDPAPVVLELPHQLGWHHPAQLTHDLRRDGRRRRGTARGHSAGR